MPRMMLAQHAVAYQVSPRFYSGFYVSEPRKSALRRESNLTGIDVLNDQFEIAFDDCQFIPYIPSLNAAYEGARQ